MTMRPNYNYNDQPPPLISLPSSGSSRRAQHQPQQQQHQQHQQQQQQQQQQRSQMKSHSVCNGGGANNCGCDDCRGGNSCGCGDSRGVNNCGCADGRGGGSEIADTIPKTRPKASAPVLAKFIPASKCESSAACATSSDQATSCSEPPTPMLPSQLKPVRQNRQGELSTPRHPQQQHHLLYSGCSPGLHDGEGSSVEDVDEDEVSSTHCSGGDVGSATTSDFVTSAPAANNSYSATACRSVGVIPGDGNGGGRRSQNQLRQQQLAKSQHQQLAKTQQQQLVKSQQQQMIALRAASGVSGCCGDEDSDGDYHRRTSKNSEANPNRDHPRSSQPPQQEQWLASGRQHSDSTSVVFAQSPAKFGKTSARQQQEQQLQQQQQIPQRRQQQQQNYDEHGQGVIQRLFTEFVGCGHCASCARYKLPLVFRRDPVPGCDCIRTPQRIAAASGRHSEQQQLLLPPSPLPPQLPQLNDISAVLGSAGCRGNRGRRSQLPLLPSQPPPPLLQFNGTLAAPGSTGFRGNRGRRSQQQMQPPLLE